MLDLNRDSMANSFRTQRDDPLLFFLQEDDPAVSPFTRRLDQLVGNLDHHGVLTKSDLQQSALRRFFISVLAMFDLATYDCGQMYLSLSQHGRVNSV